MIELYLSKVTENYAQRTGHGEAHVGAQHDVL